MSKVWFSISMSLDGYVAGPNPREEAPLKLLRGQHTTRSLEHDVDPTAGDRPQQAFPAQDVDGLVHRGLRA